MPEVNIKEYRDVDELFKQNHVGQIDKIVRRFESERKQLQRELGNLVGQNYVKILEAATAVDQMKEAVDGIDMLLSSIDEQLTIKEKTSDDSNQSLPLNQPSASELPVEQQIWTNIFETNYELAAQLLHNALGLSSRKGTKSQRSLARAKILTMDLCKRTLSSPSSHDQTETIKSIRALVILSGQSAESIISTLLSERDRLTDNIITTLIIANELGIDRHAFIMDAISKLSLPADEKLSTAIHLLESPCSLPPVKSIANSLFKEWLETIPPVPTLPQLFELSLKIANISHSALPEQWTLTIKNRLQLDQEEQNMNIPASLLAPLLGLFSNFDSAVDIDEMEKYLVPRSLPKVSKL